MIKNIFLPLTKVDAAQRLVFGVAAVEELDKSREIFDYDSSKPHFQKWSQEVEKLSLTAVEAFGDQAKSYGNLRQMHDKVAAGKIAQPIVFNDVNKTIEICTKVVDDGAWAKVQSGVYTGFSIGGNYVKVWDDPTVNAAKRYTADPFEISLVDLPCMPGATFNYIKSANAQELRKFVSVELTVEDIPMAVTKAARALSITDGNPHARAAHVVKRARELKVDVSGFAKAYITEFGGQIGQKVLAKGLYDVSDVASILMNLNYCQRCLESEAEYEGDNSDVPARLKEVMTTLAAILVDLVKEETGELLAKTATQTHETLGKDLNKMKQFFKTHATALAGLRKSTDADVIKMLADLDGHQTHMDAIVKAHGEMAEHLSVLQLGMPLSDAEKAAAAVLAKSVAGEPLSKATEDRLAKMEASQTDVVGAVTNLTTLFQKYLSTTPAPATVAVTTVPVTKAADGAAGATEVTETIDPKDPEAALKLMKRIHFGGPSLVVKTA